MSSTDVFIAAVLDRSGSMEPIWGATVEAFDGFVASQANLGAGWISLTVFDDQIDTRYRAWGLADLPKLVDQADICPRGSTAMYDAIGAALADADSWLAHNQWFDGSRVCMIQTDGLENASRHFDRQTTVDAIRAHEADGWSFVYLGANQDSWAAAQAIGIADQAGVANYAFTNTGTAGASVGASASVSALRKTGTLTNIPDA